MDVSYVIAIYQRSLTENEEQEGMQSSGNTRLEISATEGD
jgi:hypothetical protein